MPSPAENGSKSLKGGRTVREGALMSGTAAADLERDGGGFLRGFERDKRSLSVVGIWRGIAYSKMLRRRVSSVKRQQVLHRREKGIDHEL